MAGEPTRTAPRDVLLLTVGDELHAVAVESVREVVTCAPLTPVPDAPHWLTGLVNLRGDVLPVVDTGRCLGGRASAATTHLVVTETAEGPAAIVATDTPRPGTLGEQVGAGSNPGAVAQYLTGDVVCTLLDLDALTGRTP